MKQLNTLLISKAQTMVGNLMGNFPLKNYGHRDLLERGHPQFASRLSVDFPQRSMANVYDCVSASRLLHKNLNDNKIPADRFHVNFEFSSSKRHINGHSSPLPKTFQPHQYVVVKENGSCLAVGLTPFDQLLGFYPCSVLASSHPLADPQNHCKTDVCKVEDPVPFSGKCEDNSFVIASRFINNRLLLAVLGFNFSGMEKFEAYFEVVYFIRSGQDVFKLNTGTDIFIESVFRSASDADAESLACFCQRKNVSVHDHSINKDGWDLLGSSWPLVGNFMQKVFSAFSKAKTASDSWYYQ